MMYAGLGFRMQIILKFRRGYVASTLDYVYQNQLRLRVVYMS
jgi:hypothetical protein